MTAQTIHTAVRIPGAGKGLVAVTSNAYNEHLVWGAILVLLLTRGPGVFSVDYLIERYTVKKRLRRRPIG